MNSVHDLQNKAINKDQLRMLDGLAAQILWRKADGYGRFCKKVIGGAAPRNSRELTTLRLALESMIHQQAALLDAGRRFFSRNPPRLPADF